MVASSKTLTNNETDDLVNALVRKDVLNMVPYQSARREQSGGSCWLNANEAGNSNDLSVNLQNLNRYPDFQPQQLISAYADYAGVDNNQVLATRGADEGIEVLIRTFCETASNNKNAGNSDSIIICPPTYGMYAISAKGHAANIITLPLTNDLQLDLDGLTANKDNAKIVFICSPNNPTGDVIKRDDIISTLELFKNSALVVVDEAYIEFCPEFSTVTLLNDYPNLVILRTLSKAFALAGLRCGFTLASHNIIEMMAKIIAPYPISNPVSAIASQALTADLALMQQRVDSTNQLNQHIASFLDAQPWLVKRFSSKTNYILFQADNAQQIFAALVEHGVLIRNQSSQLGLNNCLRVSIGSIEELELFKNAVNNFNSNQQSGS
ncbi:histidinol-phosphate transaminase [Thalassotalea sp. ND16A]|uniref:histidinol-phosphate transaminase n=1 Tax=Thalassotalea sp. ND16A TaxID=1535422 RepID=UPI00051CEA3A|nr:histidinol-phosphate transaminase [Thalassotalea sp. ND16A]KGJ87486.1 Histidinol-phosphate transaminase [Thalassotalea sp. ND16A]